MNEQNSARAGTLVAGVLAADGLLHAYWAASGLWPAQDRETLARLVLNADRPSSFRPAIVGLLAGLLFLASTTLARVRRLGRLGRLLPFRLLQLGMLAVGLLLRGEEGVWIALWGGPRTTFYKLNLAAYTPACLLLCAAVAVTRSGSP